MVIKSIKEWRDPKTEEKRSIKIQLVQSKAV